MFSLNFTRWRWNLAMKNCVFHQCLYGWQINQIYQNSENSLMPTKFRYTSFHILMEKNTLRNLWQWHSRFILLWKDQESDWTANCERHISLEPFQINFYFFTWNIQLKNENVECFNYFISCRMKCFIQSKLFVLIYE